MIGMRLVEGRFKTVRKSGAGQAAKPVRRLWAKGSGKFRTMGRYAIGDRPRHVVAHRGPLRRDARPRPAGLGGRDGSRDEEEDRSEGAEDATARRKPAR